MITTLKRVFKTGFINFWRNGVVSLASILVFTVTLFVIGSLILGNAVLDATLTQFKDRVDITIYFKAESTDIDNENLANKIKSLPEIKEVIYKSSEQVLVEFREKNANDSLRLQGLDELDGVNPFSAELVIKAKDPSQYGSIVNYIENDSKLLDINNQNIIEKIDYLEDDNRRIVVEKLSQIIDTSEKFGLYISILSAIITILVAFNTIRLGIYTAREEISVMRLVGASNSYIRGPFIVEGVMYGVISALFTLAIFYPITGWISNGTGNFYGGIDLFNYYINNFPLLFFTLIGVGVIIGIVSSALAVRRYLKV